MLRESRKKKRKIIKTSFLFSTGIFYLLKGKKSRRRLFQKT